MTPEAALVRGMRRGALVVLVIELGRSLASLLQGPDERAWLQWLGFALLTSVAGTLIVVRRGDRPPGRRLRLVLLATVVTASVSATAGVPADRLLSSDHWSWFIIGWFFVAIMVGERPLVVGGAIAGHLVLVLVQVQLAGPLDRPQIAQFGIRAALLVGAQLLFGTSAFIIQNIATDAERLAADRARARTDETIAEEVLADKRRRTEQIAATATPLLRDLSDGRLSPDDPEVRRRSMIEAGRLRRLMAEAEQAGDPLGHELRACVDLAERAGVRVDVAYRGSGPEPGLEVRRLLTEPIIEVLAGAYSRARVTVDGNDRELVVSALADLAPGRAASGDGADAAEEGRADVRRAPAAPDREVDVSFVHAPDQVWVTARWQPA